MYFKPFNEQFVDNLLKLIIKLIKRLAAIAITSALLGGCNSQNSNDITPIATMSLSQHLIFRLIVTILNNWLMKCKHHQQSNKQQHLLASKIIIYPLGNITLFIVKHFLFKINLAENFVLKPTDQ